MSDPKRKVPVPESLLSSYYETQPERLAVEERHKIWKVGVPKEETLQENRIALVPSSVKTLIAKGQHVCIQAGAGEKTFFSDLEYSEKGAEIVLSKEDVFQSDIILKVAPPTPAEIEMMRPNQILISPLQLPIITPEYLTKLREKRVIALAMEYIQDKWGTFPVVRIMSELAGTSAVLTAAELMATTRGGKGVLLGGVSGVQPARIVILGAGIVAEYAIHAALGLGAEVRVFDNNVYKLKRLQNAVGRRLYTSAIDSTALEKELMRADVAIGAIHSKSGRTPVVVSEDMVRKMKPGAVIVDVSIDQGGCFATSRLTSLDNPTFEEHGIIHYCVPNIPSKFSRTASMAISNIMTPILLEAAQMGGMEKMLLFNRYFRHGVYMYKGHLTNDYLGKRFNLKSTNLELLITSNL
ncbi:MAG TPA: alanine dehydrogenase [Phaeodactylibacter sp.]|nr:alanine dehydrogenase [Phaeodactylibacter sp.]